MDLDRQQFEIESVPLQEVAEPLSRTRPFALAGWTVEGFVPPPGLETVDRVRARAGAVLAEPGEPRRSYCVVLDGEIRAQRPEPDGSLTLLGVARAGDGFGESPLLSGKVSSPFIITATRDSVLIRFSEEAFWALLACCPAVRKAILADMAQRLQIYQVEALHREKLVSLGTLAAGLMHELHNPGSAAKRSASQLRENLLRLQRISIRFGSQPRTPLQLECMRSLLEQTLCSCHAPAMSTIAQSDAEEAMADWLSAAGVDNAFNIAPVLVSVGLDTTQLVCARDAFDGPGLSDALNWLEALVSSISQVCAIEESVARISDLVMAVKKFAYDERSPARELDVHDSLQSTLTILGHKLRLKGVSVEKCFSAVPSTIRTRGSALSQVWTNLIDNAADASPENGKIEIATWTEPEKDAGPEPRWLAVSIADRGAGIPADVLPRIFEPFFTTKPQGSGTGLGLEIVHRIVTQKFGGAIQVDSQPGNTRFTVRLPIEGPAPASCPANCP